MYVEIVSCPDCLGSGELEACFPCPKCRGTGEIAHEEDDHATRWNYCLYCGEAVEAPAKYCCEEHEEQRLMEHPYNA